MAGVIKLTEENFEDEVLRTDLPVVIDVWGPQCVPCVRLDPFVEEMSAEYDGRVKIAKIVAPESRALCGRLRVMGLPTFLLFQEGEEVERRTGDDLGEGEVRELLDAALA